MTQPSARAIEAAIGQAVMSPCLSKRGAVVFDGNLTISRGHNRQVEPFVCSGDEKCKATCRNTAIHAEQAALLRAGTFAQGREMLHVKVVDGNLVPSGPPSCSACSRLIAAARITWMWLFHEDGWKRYDAREFHRLSVEAEQLQGGGR